MTHGSNAILEVSASPVTFEVINGDIEIVVIEEVVEIAIFGQG
jgi:hypothetical protein